MNKELLIIGMSPGNSYFRQEVIDQIIPYALSRYEKIAIFIPDFPAISTYIALGYPENIARREKAIPQGNAFRNRIQKTVVSQKINTLSVYVFDWKNEEIENLSGYRESYSYIKNLYFTNKDFENDINDATEQVLAHNPFKKKEITPSDVRIGTHYILSEFAFLIFLPLYKKEFTSFTYGYHNPWPVWEKFIAGEYDAKPKGNLKFLLLPDFSKQ